MASVEELDFEGAAEFVRTAKFVASNEQKLQMYALFKQAAVGDCNTSKPGGFLSAFSADGLKWSDPSSPSSKASFRHSQCNTIARLPLARLQEGLEGYHGDATLRGDDKIRQTH